ncbi:TonB-dependent receptor [Persicobacter diffluens]|uniref:TonB-dependent receptor n=1 Tax=Persicobacter diffluens TaxID=981 RepID=A0AAN4W1G6_9BACT|nr:TonB-dependent receptor [Persicobacter diffluens]
MRSTFAFIFFILSISVFAQKKACLHGIILDDKNQPIVGATILQSGTQNATATDQKGEFDLHYMVNAPHQVRVSAIGYKTLEKEFDTHQHPKACQEFQLTEDILGLDQVVITATRNEMSRKEAPVVVQITDSRTLESVQAVSLVEGLAFQPGLMVENNCQNCGFTGVRMNGLETAYTQIVIDGRPIFSALNAVYGLEQIPTNMIERVEVVRGGGSALYGGNAIAGTINVITKKPMSNDAEVSTNQAINDDGAKDQSYSFGANLINKNYTSGLSFQGFHRERESWDADGDGFTEIGELNATALHLKGFYQASDYSKITLNAGYTYEDRRGGNKLDQQAHEADITEMTTHHIKSAGINFEQFTKNRNHKFSAYYSLQQTDRDSYYGAGQDPNAYGYTEGFTGVGGLQYVGSFEQFLGGSAIYTSGVEGQQERLEDRMPGYDRHIDQEIQQIGWYNQLDWKVTDKFKVNAGLRLDGHSEVKNAIINPRLSFLYEVNENLQARIGYARGFRGPQVFDEDLHITAVGGDMQLTYNADNLEAETSDSFTASLDYNYNWGAHQLGLTIDAFYTEHNNAFIVEANGHDENGHQLFERRNGSGATIKGISLAPKYAYGSEVLLQAGITYQQSFYHQAVQWAEEESLPGEKQFLKTPNLYGFYTLSYMPNEKFTLNLSGNYTGKMLVGHYAGYIEQDQLEEVEDFFTQNIKLSYIFEFNSSRLTLEGGVQNIFNQFQNDFDQGEDRDAGYVYGPLKPRTYFIGLRFNL